MIRGLLVLALCATSAFAKLDKDGVYDGNFAVRFFNKGTQPLGVFWQHEVQKPGYAEGIMETVNRLVCTLKSNEHCQHDVFAGHSFVLMRQDFEFSAKVKVSKTTKGLAEKGRSYVLELSNLLDSDQEMEAYWVPTPGATSAKSANTVGSGGTWWTSGDASHEFEMSVLDEPVFSVTINKAEREL